MREHFACRGRFLEWKSLRSPCLAKKILHTRRIQILHRSLGACRGIEGSVQQEFFLFKKHDQCRIDRRK